MQRGDVVEVATDVFLARGTDVNWVLLRDGRELTVVDTGWAGDLPLLLASIEQVGCRPEDVRAVLVTHAHIDHLGGVNHLNTRSGTPATWTRPRSPTPAASTSSRPARPTSPGTCSAPGSCPGRCGWPGSGR